MLLGLKCDALQAGLVRLHFGEGSVGCGGGHIGGLTASGVQ